MVNVANVAWYDIFLLHILVFIILFCAVFFEWYINYMAYIKIVFLVFFVGISACTPYALLPHSINMADIPWRGPKNLVLENCPNINGVYYLVPLGERRVDVSFKEIFQYPERVGTKRIAIRDIGDEIYKVKDDDQYMSIWIQGNKVRKLIGYRSYGDVYSINLLISPDIDEVEQSSGVQGRVGCYDGKYIYRTVKSFGSFEFSPKTRMVQERFVWKDDDGRLVIKTYGAEYVQFKSKMVESNGHTSVFMPYIN